MDTLPDEDVLIRVACSSLNYKDALSATGNKGVTRNYPLDLVPVCFLLDYLIKISSS